MDGLSEYGHRMERESGRRNEEKLVVSGPTVLCLSLYSRKSKLSKGTGLPTAESMMPYCNEPAHCH